MAVRQAEVTLVDFRPRTWHTIRVVSLARVVLVGLLIGNLGRIPFFSTGDRNAPILVNDLLVALLLGAGVVRAIRTKSLRFDRVSLFALAFALVGGLSTLWSIPRFGLTGFEVFVSLSYLARWLFYFGVYVVLTNALSSDDVLPVWSTLEALLLVFAIFGIFQSIALPGFAQLVYPSSRLAADWDVQGHRLVSTWLDPNFSGGFLMLGLLVQVAQISVGQRIAVWKPAVLTIALLMTVSRSGVLAFVVGLGVIFWIRGLSRRTLRLAAALGTVVAAGIPLALGFTGQLTKLTLDVSALHRVVAWKRAAYVFSQHPIFGIGFNAWGFVQERFGYERMYAFSYSLDGGLIFVALMTGVVGLALYIGMMGAVIRSGRRIWTNQALHVAHRGTAIGVTAGMLALAVHSLFGNSLFLPFLMETLWVQWALVFALAKQAPTVVTSGSHA